MIDMLKHSVSIYRPSCLDVDTLNVVHADARHAIAIFLSGFIHAKFDFLLTMPNSGHTTIYTDAIKRQTYFLRLKVRLFVQYGQP